MHPLLPDSVGIQQVGDCTDGGEAVVEAERVVEQGLQLTPMVFTTVTRVEKVATETPTQSPVGKPLTFSIPAKIMVPAVATVGTNFARNAMSDVKRSA